MKIVFFGTPSFAASNLDFLHKKGHNIVSVISSPDKEKGRGKKKHREVKEGDRVGDKDKGERICVKCSL